MSSVAGIGNATPLYPVDPPTASPASTSQGAPAAAPSGAQPSRDDQQEAHAQDASNQVQAQNTASQVQAQNAADLMVPSDWLVVMSLRRMEEASAGPGSGPSTGRSDASPADDDPEGEGLLDTYA